MVQSDSYTIIKALIEKDLLVIEHPGLVDWLGRLQSKGEIREGEFKDLIQLADKLKIYEAPRSDVVSVEEITFF